MSYHEEDFSDMLFAWPAVEGRIAYLYELDPTHVTAHPARIRCDRADPVTTVTRSPAPFCVATDPVVTKVLLELDPTHCQVG